MVMKVKDKQQVASLKNNHLITLVFAAYVGLQNKIWTGTIVRWLKTTVVPERIKDS